MGKTPDPPKPPKFYPIDIQQAITDQLSADIWSWNYSKNDLAERFPGLVAAQNQQIEQAYNQLTGPVDPTIQNDFVTKGLETGLASTSGGSAMVGLGLQEGSAGRGAESANVASNLQSLQDYYRENFAQQLALNLPPAVGLSGADVAQLAISNTVGQNAANQLGYQSQLSGIYGAGQSGVATGQNIAPYGSIIASLGKLYNTPPSG
jgi:hypothetical protein